VSVALSAIVKQAARMPASSSSGFVPGSPLNRVPNEYSAVIFPLPVSIVPWPLATSPSQRTVEVRAMSSGTCMRLKGRHSGPVAGLAVPRVRAPKVSRWKTWRGSRPACATTRLDRPRARPRAPADRPRPQRRSARGLPARRRARSRSRARAHRFRDVSVSAAASGRRAHGVRARARARSRVALAHANLANVLFAANEYEAACREYERALRSRPLLREAHKASATP